MPRLCSIFCAFIMDSPISLNKRGTTHTRADASTQPEASKNHTCPRLLSKPTNPETTAQTQPMLLHSQPNRMSQSPRCHIKQGKNHTFIRIPRMGRL
jgi:hypothetical protein